MASTGTVYPPGASVGRTSIYDPDLVSTHATGVWKNAPCFEWMCNPMHGVLLSECWQTYDATATTGDYVLTQATTGAAAISAANPGVLELDCDSTTAAQGAQIQRAKSCFVPLAGRTIWAEFQFKVVDTFDKVQLFIGLAPIDTTIIAGSANSLDNQIAFWTVQASAGALLFGCEKATVGTPIAAATIAEDTWISVGFEVNGVTSVTGYVNGVALGTTFATANIPIVALYPSFVCQSHGVNDPILHLRPYRVFSTM